MHADSHWPGLAALQLIPGLQSQLAHPMQFGEWLLRLLSLCAQPGHLRSFALYSVVYSRHNHLGYAPLQLRGQHGMAF